MVDFNLPNLTKIHSVINPNDVGEDGLETEFHTTLLYGLHPEVPLGKVTSIIRNYEFLPCLLHNVSLFENEKSDVLKFDVKSANFDLIHDQLKLLPNSEKFPEYHPHMTIAYLKPGTGQKYLSTFRNLKFVVDPIKVVYSHPDGTKDDITIN